MTESFRSQVARELAGILADERKARPKSACSRYGKSSGDDLGYFTDRSSKQLRLAAQASSCKARKAHETLAELHQAKARKAMSKAMQFGTVVEVEFLRIDFLRDLDDLLGKEAADRFRMLKAERGGGD